MTTAPRTGARRRVVPWDGGVLLSRLSDYRIDHSDHDDPVLVRPDGSRVETWREHYPYDDRMTRAEYDRLKRQLQIELLKLQYWAKDSGARIVVLFEGRDAAGKGGTIKRFTEHLNPRGSRVVALTKPTERESTQWYFQRYLQHLPAAGEIVLFDRSWYNRAGVEQVMGFCTRTEYGQFLHTDTPHAPWTVVKSNDKKRGRIEAMRYVLQRFDYPDKNHEAVGRADPQIVGSAADVLSDETDF